MFLKVMLSDYGRRDQSLNGRIKKIFLFFFVAAVFLVGSAVLVYLYQVPSVQQQRVIEEENRKIEELSRRLEIAVLDGGYLERQASGRLIYVPVVLLEISNRSEEMVPAIEIRSSFSMMTTHICAGSLVVRNFLPGERQQLRLSCSESVMFGTVVTGIGRDQTLNALEYSVRVGAGGVFAPTIRGIIEYKLFRP